MNSRVKAALIYIDSNQVAKASGGSLSQSSNGEQLFGATDVFESDGIFSSEVSFDQVNTVDGGGPAIRQAYENRKNVKVKTTTVDGNTYTCEMRIIKIDDKWTGKDGSNTGTFNLRGGKQDRS